MSHKNLIAFETVVGIAKREGTVEAIEFVRRNVAKMVAKMPVELLIPIAEMIAEYRSDEIAAEEP